MCIMVGIIGEKIWCIRTVFLYLTEDAPSEIDVLSVMFASVEKNQNVIFALERPDGNRMIGGLIVKHYTFRRLSPEFSAGLRGRINRTNQANLACE